MQSDLRRLLTQLSCFIWGHHVDNHAFAAAARQSRSCRCGAPYLAQDRLSLTRVRHTLSCFLGHHTYERLLNRNGWHEYVCVQCGHPLLFRADRDPYLGTERFKKKVRYLCGLFGHHVECVGTREGLMEYACHCGHTFLQDENSLSTIRHPMICVVAGHWVQFLTDRAGFSEYVCQNCGHPFCFANASRLADHAPGVAAAPVETDRQSCLSARVGAIRAARRAGT